MATSTWQKPWRVQLQVAVCNGHAHPLTNGVGIARFAGGTRPSCALRVTVAFALINKKIAWKISKLYP